ncbi:MAG: endonuclease NucS [Candidatus Nezhaarchaeota archaeon]|nr:endonuclease NucS [Candidatus Nezhaarchaeota archaeon]
MLSGVDVLRQPDVREALGLVQRAVEQGMLVVLMGSCRVDYVGRGSSKLGLGERLVIYKPDGSLIVHRPRGAEPVNWMPAGSYIVASVEEGGLRLRAVRRRPFEELRVSFRALYLVAAGRLIDREELVMYASEEEVRKAVSLRPSLIEPGFKPYEEEKRVQLLSREGYVDVVGEDGEGNLLVVELKRVRVDRGAVMQLKQYVDALGSRTSRRVRGVLAGPSITKEALTLASSLGLEFKRLDLKEAWRVLREAAGSRRALLDSSELRGSISN